MQEAFSLGRELITYGLDIANFKIHLLHYPGILITFRVKLTKSIVSLPHHCIIKLYLWNQEEQQNPKNSGAKQIFTQHKKNLFPVICCKHINFLN